MGTPLVEENLKLRLRRNKTIATIVYLGQISRNVLDVVLVVIKRTPSCRTIKNKCLEKHKTVNICKNHCLPSAAVILNIIIIITG